MANLALVAPQFAALAAASPSARRRGRPPLFAPLFGANFGASLGARRAGIVAAFGFNRRSGDEAKEIVKDVGFARISPSNSNEMTTSTSTPPLPVPPSSPYIGSPLLWIGVGVGVSVIFQVVAARVKKYALQQAFKTMMDQASPQGGQFNNPMFPPGLQYPFPPVSPPPPSNPASPPVTQVPSQPVVEVGATVTEVEATTPYEVRDEPEVKETQKKYAFVDVSPEEISQSERSYSKESIKEPVMDPQTNTNVSSNGTLKQEDVSSSGESQSRRSTPPISVEALEKMMEDPTVQKMVYPYLPEEMRNPTSFKWMMQNPQFRQQMQEMLNNMGGSADWDNRMTESLKNFDLSSPEVKQQFEQIGLTPEQVISKIMANPDVAMAFQNPRVQAAILDCSQNPLSIAKYQNDKEVMDVFTKISELFPGVTGYP